MKISKNDIYSKIFGFNPSTYYRWKEDKRPIIDLIDKYFSINELNEFLNKKEISRFELHEEQKAKTSYSARKYLNIFLQKNYKIADTINEEFMNFYFNTLVYCINNIDNINVFNPMTIQKVSLNYLYNINNNAALDTPTFMRKVATEHSENLLEERRNLMPMYEIGIELLDDFDCYTNQFLQDCIFQDFKPLIDFVQNNDIDKDAKVEAYSHILLFITYKIHQNKTAEEKMTSLLIILRTLQNIMKKDVKQENDLKFIPIIDFLENMSLEVRIRQNLELIEKNFDKILLAIKEYNFN